MSSGYIPATDAEREEMLAAVGAASIDELFAIIPETMRCGALDLPDGMSEAEVRRYVEGLAAKNTVFRTICRGAGAYRHYIPSLVTRITNKDEFVTAYTPYQAEISQGVLQSIFEYQTMICELTGMDVANASVYDGASAAAEAVNMTRERKRTKALVSAAANPQVIETIKTYAFGCDCKVEMIPEKDGKTDLAALAELLDEQTACVYVQQPNFYGLFEDVAAIAELTHEQKAKLIGGYYPIALGLIQTPAEAGCDIAVGEGQPLGLPLSFGGPYLGFMACGDKLARKLPGRIVGQTVDADGERSFVLTLQAREQHIRREKASSNICSNQALCALTAAVYLATMGRQGFRQVAAQCAAKAHYAAAAITKLAGYGLVYDGEFFNEFVTATPVPAAQILQALADKGILGGLPLADDRILWCFTEMNTKEEIDAVVATLEEVARA